MWFGGKTHVARRLNQLSVLAALLALALGNVLTLILNDFITRDRPFVSNDLFLLFYQPTDPSFPSNPAVLGFAIAGSIWKNNRSLGTVLFAVSAIWSFSRIYAGVCYPSDILAGAAIGVSAAYTARHVLRIFSPITNRTIRIMESLYLA